LQILMPMVTLMLLQNVREIRASKCMEHLDVLIVKR